MHTPFTIGKAFSDGLKKFTAVKTVIEITGLYQESGSKLYSRFYKNSYKKFYFDYLKDSETGDKITILVSEDIRASLTNNRLCKVCCFADIRADNKTSVSLFLFVDEVINGDLMNLNTVVDPRKEEISRRKSELIRRFRSKNKQQDVSLRLKILIQKKQLPKIALVQPIKNETLRDIKENLGQHYDKYDFKDVDVNIRNEQEIIKTLKKLDSEENLNLIALFRGGGDTEDFDVFDGTAMGETVCELRTAFVIAVGHAGNEPFVQKVSDRYFSTPSDFGSYLKDVYINSGREDDLTEQEENLKKFQNDLATNWDKLKQKQDELNKQAQYLQNEAISVKNETEELRTVKENLETVKEENIKRTQQLEELQNQIDSDKIKDRKTRSQAALALVLISMFLGATAAYFIMAAVFDTSRDLENTNTNSNSNIKTSSSVSNLKNK